MKERLKNALASRLMRYGAGLPDRLYLRILYRLKMGYWPNLKHPKTFNEKLQWLKLYNRRADYTKMVDKLAVKDYVASVIGSEHVIPTLGVWDTPEQIDWDSLPPQFVLKTTHGGGGCGVVICKDKSTFNRAEAIAKLNLSLQQDIYKNYREWPYKNVPKRILAEKYMSDDGKELDDFKVHNFNGVPRVILVCRERFKGTPMTEDFYSPKWEHLDISRPGHDSPGLCERPDELEEMLQLSRELAEGHPFVRTDFYTIKHKVYFGELTFFPAGGMAAFSPKEADKLFGSWIKIEMGGGKTLLTKGKSYFLIVEKKQEELKDYKMFCFNGKVRMFKIDFNRFSGHRANYYDTDGHLLPFGEKMCPPNPDKELQIPASMPEMIKMAERLSAGIPFLRVDFYNVADKVYFGEMTFFPAGGMGQFVPNEWDGRVGGWLIIN